MSLTVVVGSSGSGKTTYLEDVHKLRPCCYIRQYHMLRPYIPVRKIPSFDPSQLPYWKLYSEATTKNGGKQVSYNPNVKIGGSMAGQFIPGLSGGQRKMLLFELVRQRTSSQSGLLIIFDEPFAGVTDDFVPFIVERLNEMRQKHTILLVTNDHVETLKKMADSIITVSAIDRSKVQINDTAHDRKIALLAVADCPLYQHKAGNQDIWFFLQTELLTSPQVGASLGFMVFLFVLFLVSYWGSKPGLEALVLVATQIISLFSLNPFLVALPDWRNIMIEEANALMHCSVQTNLALKSCVTLLLLLMTNIVSFGCLNGCTDSDVINSIEMWVSMLFDSASLTLPFLCFGLYTRLPLQIVQLIGSLPFLFMIFFSTTFSPGAGLEGFKTLRYLFPRFYLWCRLPGVRDNMEGCPNEDANVWYTILTGCLGLILFIVAELLRHKVIRRKVEKKKELKFEEAKRTRRASVAQVQRQLSGRISLPDGMVAPAEDDDDSRVP